MDRDIACTHRVEGVLGAGDIQYYVNDVLLFRVARRVCSATVGCAACHHFCCGCCVAVAWCYRYHVLCESVEVLGEGGIFLTDRNPGDDRCRGTDESVWNHCYVRGCLSNVGTSAECVGASRSDKS